MPFFSVLYHQPQCPVSESICSELQKLSLPTLSPEEVEALDAPISTLEIELAIASLPPSKTPGPDGLPGDWYKRYAESIAPKLQKLFS